MNLSYRAQSPTRVDLSGGTLDLWPLYLFVDSAIVVNLSIDIFTFAELEIFENQSKIEISLEDLNFKSGFENLEALLKSNQPELNLIKNIISYFKPHFGFSLKTRSESPVGGGLGGSSSLCVSVIKVFSQALQLKFDKYQMVNIAHDIEAQVLKTPTGTQDYFPAIAPGLGRIDYAAGKVTQTLIPYDKSFFKEHFLLIDTGKSHHSGINNWDVYKKVIDKNQTILKALYEIKKISEETTKVCEEKNWEKLPELFQREYKSRRELSSTFSSPEIESLAQLSSFYGAKGIKICGAGGGGCVLLYVEPGKKEKVVQGMQKNNFKIYNI